MKVKIFTTNFIVYEYIDESARKKLEDDINACLLENPSATIEWKQTTATSSSAAGNSFLGAVESTVRLTTLTAIVKIK